VFSLPFNPKLSETQFYEFLEFCKENKNEIFDIYFTCRIHPFTQDAMGDIYTNINDVAQIIKTVLYIQNVTGISVSATFNNISVPPTQENLDLFIENFKPIYDAGIKSITIPHSHWVATKQLKKNFPDLYIKNTILRNVQKANEVFELAKIGFNYINLHRDVMRDLDTLKEIKEVSKLTGVKIALLANEGCVGNCPMMVEHFEFNNNRLNGPAYFQNSISRVSCQKWNIEDKSIPFKSANISPWKEDWDELLQYVDVFKMHGRESITQLQSSINIIKNYKNNSKILYEEFKEYNEQFDIPESPLNIWRKTIKNCKFNCWKCNVCENIANNKITQKVNEKLISLVNELVDSVNYNNTFDIPGLTSKRVQNLLFGLGSISKKYLEIGSAMGSTAAPVGVNDIEVNCIDLWKDDIQDEKNKLNLPSNTKEEFIKNTQHIKNLRIFENDFNNIDIKNFNDIDLFFYDGPHDKENTYNALKKFYNCFSNVSILIFDDANWIGVTEGVNDALRDLNSNIIYSKHILNEIEDASMWWNGLYIVVIEK
jgi:predicted O-methyltransferase YrrM